MLEPMALQVVSAPAISTRNAAPELVLAAQRLAVQLGVDQVGEQIVGSGRVLGALRELCLEVAQDLAHRLGPHRLVARSDADHPHHPLGEPAARRHAKQPVQHGQREVLGVAGHRVAAARRGDFLAPGGGPPPG